MRIQLRELDAGHLFLLGGQLWTVKEVVTQGDIIQHSMCYPLTHSHRGTSTITTAFYEPEVPNDLGMRTCYSFEPTTRVTIFETQLLQELERD